MSEAAVAALQATWTGLVLADLAASDRNAIVGGPFGSNLVSSDYTARGVPVIRGQNMGGGRWVGGEFAFVSEEKAESLRTNWARPGDIVFTQRGTIGQVAIVPDAPWDQYVVSQSQMKATIDPAVADPLFVYYSFSSPAAKEYIAANAIQTGVPHTNLGQLRAHPMRVPPLPVQRAIASVLGTLDDKIEQNRRTARALERLARAIFRAWFVDFEPVKAKAAGATAFPSMPHPVFDALPTNFVDSAVGPVPAGWDVGALKDLAALSKTQIKPQGNQTEVFDYFSIPAFDAGMRAVVEAGSTIKSNKFLVMDGAVLLSKLNPRIPRVWLPPPPRGRRQIASTEFLVFVPRSVCDRCYLYCQFQQAAFRDELAQGASGTSNSHQRVRPNDLLEKVIVVPPTSMRKGFADIAGPIFALAATNHIESATLTEMRDYLLPKLLSGQVRVSDTDQLVPRGLA